MSVVSCTRCALLNAHGREESVRRDVSVTVAVLRLNEGARDEVVIEFGTN